MKTPTTNSLVCYLQPAFARVAIDSIVEAEAWWIAIRSGKQLVPGCRWVDGTPDDLKYLHFDTVIHQPTASIDDPNVILT